MIADALGTLNKFDPIENKHISSDQVNYKNKLGNRIKSITSTKDSKYYFMSTTYISDEQETKYCNFKCGMWKCHY